MKLRSWALTVILAAGVVAPVAGPAQVACAAEGNHAALVVDTGRGAEPYDMCVDLRDKRQVSGLELIKMAHQQFDLQYEFGHGEQAVCQLANVPKETPPENCLDGASEFWAYWIGDGSGGWSTSPQGAGSTMVEDGDVQGWSYGSGQSASTHPKPRDRADGSPFTFDSICAAAESSPKKDDGERRDKPSEREDKNDDVTIPLPGDNERKPKPKDKETPGTAPSAPSEPDERLIDSAPDVSELEIAPSPSPTSGELPANATSARSADEDDAQPPIAGVLALVVTMAMAGVAVYLIRRRTPEPED